MGIRFSCHGCAKPLHIKTELAGRRGVCPDCRVKFRIPLTDSEFSSPLQESEVPESRAVSKQSAVSQSAVSQAAVSQAASGIGISDPGYSGTAQAVLQLDQGASGAAPQPASTSQKPTPQEPVPQEPAEQDAEQDIELLSGDTSATWYVRPPSGGQYGPATVDVLKNWIAEGRVAKNALLWRDGWAQWREASEALPEISETLPGGVNLAADDPFSDAKASAKLTTRVAMEKTSPVQSNLSGDSSIGSIRRKRSSRRITLVAVLAALVVGLIVTLVLVAMTRS